ncbi:MAG: SCP2 sterol-binding domain-containing protein [Promethearchaeota archaeon]
MLNIEMPDDLISLSLFNIFSYRKKDKKFIKHVSDWNKKIVLHISPFYPVVVIFQGTTIRFEKNYDENADLKVKIDINTMLDIAYGRINPFDVMNEGKMEIEGLGEDSSMIVKFYNVFVDSMIMIAADPNIKYYELNKETR